MVISHKYKYIFFHVQKNAGSSIRHVLVSNYDGQRMGQHTSVVSAQRRLGKQTFKDYYKFAVVRNPYSRMVSWYNSLIKLKNSGKTIVPESFEDMILNQKGIYKNKPNEIAELWRGQFDFLNIRGEIHLDYIIQYENLVDNFSTVMDNLFKNKNIDMPHLKHWGVGNDWEKFYTPELKEIVYNKFKKDFEVFKYGK